MIASCQLVRRIDVGGVDVGRAAAGAPWLVALHHDGGDAGSLVALAERVAPFASRCCAQAPFSRNPFLGSGDPGPPRDDQVRAWGAYRGYSWFRTTSITGSRP